MRHILSMLLVVGCLLEADASFSYAQTDPSTPDWNVALYDISAREVVIVRPNTVETQATPECFAASTDSVRYSNWYFRPITISPDYRFLAASMPDSFPGILVADLENGTCFEIRIDETYPGYTDVGVFNPTSTQLAFSWGPPGRLLIIDLIAAPGTILHTLDFGPEGALPAYWDADGIYFVTTCYECGIGGPGRLDRWDPSTGIITATERVHTARLGDRMPLTDEILIKRKNTDYPSSTGYDFAYNVIEYAAGELETVGQVVYHDLKLQFNRAHPRWVLDGNAFFILQTVVLRDGSTVPVIEDTCGNIIAGTPAGWLAQVEQSIYYCQMVDGKAVSTRADCVVDGPTILLGQSPLGTTVSEAITLLPPTDKF